MDNYEATLAALDSINRLCTDLGDPMTDLATMYVRHGAEMEVVLSGLIAAVKSQDSIDGLLTLRLEDAEVTLAKLDTFRKFHNITER